MSSWQDEATFGVRCSFQYSRKPQGFSPAFSVRSWMILGLGLVFTMPFDDLAALEVTPQQRKKAQ